MRNNPSDETILEELGVRIHHTTPSRARQVSLPKRILLNLNGKRRMEKKYARLYQGVKENYEQAKEAQTRLETNPNLTPEEQADLRNIRDQAVAEIEEDKSAMAVAMAKAMKRAGYTGRARTGELLKKSRFRGLSRSRKLKLSKNILLRIYTKFRSRYRSGEKALLQNIETVVAENIGSIATVQNDKLYINEAALDKFAPGNSDIQKNVAQEVNKIRRNSHGEDNYTVTSQMFDPTRQNPRPANSQTGSAAAYLRNYPNGTTTTRNGNDPLDVLMQRGTVRPNNNPSQGGQQGTSDEIVDLLRQVINQQSNIESRLNVIEQTIQTSNNLPIQPSGGYGL